MSPAVETCPDDKALLDAVMARFHAALKGPGGCVVCLSGGSTPQPFYAALAQEIRAGRVPAAEIHWIIGDERAVPFDHPRSNYGMMRRILFDPAGIPAEFIHPMPADRADLEAAARAFEHELQGLYGSSKLDEANPFLDFNLLGLGDDGHTASMFPGIAELTESRRWVVPTRAPDGEARMSLTFPVLNSARSAVVMIEGATKRAALQRWTSGATDLPASRLAPVGTLTVLADAEANPR